MKPLQTLSIFFFLFLSGAVTLNAQTIHVVNNTPGSPGGANVYTTVDDAITAATDGDIIHIIPSSDSYSGFTVTKQLSFYGIGFNPDKQAPILSKVTDITLDEGSSGSLFEGLDINSIRLDANLSNITIRKNNFRYRIIQRTGTINSLLIHNNLFHQSGTSTPTAIDLNTDNTTSNVVVSNNILTGRSDISGGNQIMIQNNLFLSGGTRNSFDQLNNAYVANNIFYGKSPGGSSVSYTSFENNLSFGSANDEFPLGTNNNTGSGNYESVDPQFVDVEIASGAWDFTWDPNLQTGSPTIGAGTDGSDLGIFGGSASFDLTGVPRPLIQTLILPAMIGTDQDLDVTIRARGN